MGITAGTDHFMRARTEAAAPGTATQATLTVLLPPLQVDEGGWGQACSPVLVQLREAMAKRTEHVQGVQHGWPPRLSMPFSGGL